MRKINRLLLAVFWMAFSLYSWGTLMADLDWMQQNHWSTLKETSRDNIGICAAAAAAGPIGAAVSALATNFNEHGWELWGKRKDAKNG